MNLLEGKLLAEGQRIGIVAGRFNEFITSKLLGGAVDAFKRHGGDESNIDLAWVPGAFEVQLLTSTWSLTRLPKVLLTWVYKPGYRLFSVF